MAKHPLLEWRSPNAIKNRWYNHLKKRPATISDPRRPLPYHVQHLLMDDQNSDHSFSEDDTEAWVSSWITDDDLNPISSIPEHTSWRNRQVKGNENPQYMPLKLGIMRVQSTCLSVFYIYMFAAKLSIIFSMQLIIKLCVLYYAKGFVGWFLSIEHCSHMLILNPSHHHLLHQLYTPIFLP